MANICVPCDDVKPMEATAVVDPAGQAYQQALEFLQDASNLADDLKSLPTLVDLSNPLQALQEDDSNETQPRSHHAWMAKLEELERLPTSSNGNAHLEMDLEAFTISQLTRILLNGTSDKSLRPSTATPSLLQLQQLGQSIPRRVCQHPFVRNDLVWVCRTCQADETCVLCHACFSASNHDGHDVAFYHAHQGGCCDCGDADAWDPAGFCPRHGQQVDVAGGPLSAELLERVHGLVRACAEWLVTCASERAKNGHARTDNLVGNVRVDGDNRIVGAQSFDDGELEDEEMPDVAAIAAEQHGRLFVPAAASTSRIRVSEKVVSEHEGSSYNRPPQRPPTRAEGLGFLGRKEEGLYLVLHADEITTIAQWVDALREALGGSPYFSDSSLAKVVRMLRKQGQLVLCTALDRNLLSIETLKCWMDGDRVASSQVGAVLLNKAAKVGKLITSIATRRDLQWEQRSVAVLEWLTAVARSCDPLCQRVAESILTEHLVPVLQTVFFTSARITKAWQSLLLALLAVPTFKSHLAAAYCDTYQDVTAQYARGMGVYERSGYTLSVQFLNRVTYVVNLVQTRDLLGRLGKTLLETLRVAANQQAARLDSNHFCLIHRRYTPCISDLKCVLNVKGMNKLFVSVEGSFLHDWLAALGLAQWMDTQVWRAYSEGHVETESRGWVAAFNASISLGSLFDRLLMWEDEDDEGFGATQTGVTLCLHCINFLAGWQEKEVNPSARRSSYSSTPNSFTLDEHNKCPMSLPYSTVSFKRGTALCLPALPVKQITPWSFHLPLHRFVAACLRETCRRRENGVDTLLTLLKNNEYFTGGFCEFPVLVVARVAQVRADLWKRNGSRMDDQVLNYSEPPFCRSLRDADVLLLQFSCLGRGPAVLVNLLLHRFGLFQFCGLEEATAANADLYRLQVRTGSLPNERSPVDIETGDITFDMPLPWSYSPAEDATNALSLLEEFLHLLIVLVSELPPIPPQGKKGHTQQAKQRLKREVIHRLASGPKTHSELNEVHQVLSHWDNNFLSEEGKELNPDDAHGACLGRTLDEIAKRKSGTLGPDKWELKPSAWEAYDPAFYHISQRSHQSAAENRPKFPKQESEYKVDPRPFGPPPAYVAHPSFLKVRRDITADAAVIAILYRTVHVHCRSTMDEATGVRGSGMYGIHSETVLSRAIHLLTIGAMAWQDAAGGNNNWLSDGGGSNGSVFFGKSEPVSTADWIDNVLLAEPTKLQDSDWYSSEDCLLVLLKKIAVEGGAGGFSVQDQTLRAGAAWLCEFCIRHSAAAKNLIGRNQEATDKTADSDRAALMKKKREEAKARAMAMMKTRAANFALAMQIDDPGQDEEKQDSGRTQSQTDESDAESQRSRSTSIASFQSISSSFISRSPSRSESDLGSVLTTASRFATTAKKMIPNRLLKSRPQCIICNEETLHRSPEKEENQKKRSRRRSQDSNALAFVAYAQCSTVQKGGGGPPPPLAFDGVDRTATGRRFVGTHVALCGHAVHSECLDSYLATSSQWDMRVPHRRKEEFRCPLCQRLSNSLIPLIDVGVDWITEAANEEAAIDTQTTSDSEERPGSTGTLEKFLRSTPWWVGRDDHSVRWDGHCAFVSATPAETEADVNDRTTELATELMSSKRRRSLRPLRKKDLYAAWGAMMRTPRFMRRRNRSPTNDQAMQPMPETNTIPDQWPSLEESASAGETLVWRRFMDLVSEISYKGDAKRLGEQSFLVYCGEFRHYQIEKAAHNITSRQTASGSRDWPSCISPDSTRQFSDSRRQEFSREKLMSKLLLAIQSFTYSCSCEAADARTLIKKRAQAITEFPSSDRGSDTLTSLLSKFGIAGLACGGNLVLMPTPQAIRDEGTQPFEGRMGRLRYFGLAAMAAAGAVSTDLIQLVMEFPLSADSLGATIAPPREGDPPHRAPVAFPLLFGNVLSHVVAALCACCGRARAHSDSLDLIWPNPSSSKRGSFIGVESFAKSSESVESDCLSFIKLGLLARILQILAGSLNIQTEMSGLAQNQFIMLLLKDAYAGKADEKPWIHTCYSVLDAALAPKTTAAKSESPSITVDLLKTKFEKGCDLAVNGAVAFLSDVGTILQVLVPAVKMTDAKQSGRAGDKLGELHDLIGFLGLEHPSDMIQNTLVRHIVANWFQNVCRHGEKAASSFEGSSMSSDLLRKRLYRTEGFRVYDWPMFSGKPIGVHTEDLRRKKVNVDVMGEPQDDGVASMEIDSVSGLLPPPTTSLVSFSSKKSVPLLGGFYENPMHADESRPRIYRLPTSYTDLYAQLASLCPDSEQIGLCLICGEVVNAHGKGECTKHSFKCGAGTCIFFLLQECQGLILHGEKAAYVQSPYVDSHGETPQYRGRPLNLDIDRYNIFRDLWSSHTVRQKVIQERSSSRQVIIPDFF